MRHIKALFETLTEFFDPFGLPFLGDSRWCNTRSDEQGYNFPIQKFGVITISCAAKYVIAIWKQKSVIGSLFYRWRAIMLKTW